MDQFSNFTKMTKIRTMTMESMEWYGTVHMDSMDYSMESIWNGMEQSIWISYGMGLYQKIHQVQYGIHVHSIDLFHGLDSMDSMDHSTWIPYGINT